MVVCALRFVTEQFAEDIVQDVFVRGWQQGGFRMPSEELSRYLYRSVLNACRNSIRHELVVSRYVRTSLAELRLGEVEYELRILDEPRNEREDVLRALIEQLPERCREVFRMSRFEGLKNREIAARLGISETAVEKHLARAVGRLGEHLRRSCSFELSVAVLSCLLANYL